MSWGTCYSAPNNIHFDFPAVMNDGRTFTTHLSPYEMNESIKKKENIKTNKDYKNYLVKNADSIIKYNTYYAFNYNCGIPTQEINNNGPPYIFKQSFEKNRPYGYSESTLKNMYLSREELLSKQVSPLLH